MPFLTNSIIAGVLQLAVSRALGRISGIKNIVYTRQTPPPPPPSPRTAPPPRYLQVSGSALGMEGQVSVFNFRGGPCYRCVFPAPLDAEAGRRCSDNGVLGTVPGEGGQISRCHTTLPRTYSALFRFVSFRFATVRFV